MHGLLFQSTFPKPLSTLCISGSCIWSGLPPFAACRTSQSAVGQKKARAFIQRHNILSRSSKEDTLKGKIFAIVDLTCPSRFANIGSSCCSGNLKFPPHSVKPLTQSSHGARLRRRSCIWNTSPFFSLFFLKPATTRRTGAGRKHPLSFRENYSFWIL